MGTDALTGDLARETGENAGTYAITQGTIAASANYTIVFTGAALTIAKAAITAVTLDNTTLTYTGTAQTVNVTAVKAGTLDVPATAYTVSGNTQTTVGDYTVRVTANDDSNYSGYAEAQFSIIPEGASTFDVSGIEDSYVYTGSEIRPVPTVKEGATVLTENTDYTLAYTGNVNVGTATITVTGIGGYSGTKTVTFAITPKPVYVVADAKEKTYGEADPALTYTVTGLVGTDALTGDLARETGENAGTYAIKQGTIAASANYTIVFTGATLTINKAAGSISYAVTSISDKTFGDPAFTNPLTKTGDGTVTYASDNTAVVTVDATTGEVTIIGNGSATITATVTDGTNYTYATKTAAYIIGVGTADMSGYITAKGYTGTYDGAAHDISVTVTTLTGATVKFGTTAGTYDLTASPTYINAGTYTVYYQVTRTDYTTVTGSANVTIGEREVTVSGITAHDKNYDGTTVATLVLGNAEFDGIIPGDILTITATGEFEDAEAGTNKTVYISGLTLGGASINNYILATSGNQTTTTASILPVGSIDRRHSGIEVRRNDTNELVDNDAYLTLMSDGTLRIDNVDIIKPADATADNPVSVSVYIPATLKDYDGTTSDTYGVGNDIIVTDVNVPVTDIYMPDTKEMINVASHAFRLDETESKTARIHTPLHLLDDYALCNGLKAEYEAGNVMTTVTSTTRYWTFSSGVYVVVPNNLTAYTCQSDGTTSVAARAISETTAEVKGTERIVIKANNGVMMGGDPDSYDLVAWPSDDRPSGMEPPTYDDHYYDGNQLEPAIISTHFTPTEYYILHDNVFHELLPTDETFVSPCKAVLRKSDPAMARNLSISVDGNESAGIHSVSCEEIETDEKWYTLDGQRLDSQPTKKGLYIRNGVKVIIK